MWQDGEAIDLRLPTRALVVGPTEHGKYPIGFYAPGAPPP
jgi:hypothetical protein